MTRRTLFSAVAAAFALPKIPFAKSEPLLKSGVAIMAKARFEESSIAMLDVELERAADWAFMMGTSWKPNHNIGDTIQVRKPARFR